MTDGKREDGGAAGDAPVVLVAGELRELAGGGRWPAGARTRFAVPGGPLDASGTETDAAVVGLVPLVSQTVDRALLEACPGLRIVANYGVGYDNIDLEAARERGVRVSNTPDVLTDATADLAVALLLAAARRLREGLELAVSGRWEGWHPTQLRGAALQGRTLGIAGAGRIGVATARRAAAFGLRILYWSRSRSEALESSLGAERAVDFDALLAGSDILSLHLPLTQETRGILGRERIERMREGAILVNTARGALVDHAALWDALRKGRLAAVGLDVYPEEPDIPARLREAPHAFVLPHLGSATREARRAMWELAARNVRAALEGREPPTAVDRTGDRS